MNEFWINPWTVSLGVLAIGGCFGILGLMIRAVLNNLSRLQSKTSDLHVDMIIMKSWVEEQKRTNDEQKRVNDRLDRQIERQEILRHTPRQPTILEA